MLKFAIPLLFVASAAIAAEESDKVWVKVAYYDTERKSTHYYLGLADKQLLDRLVSNETITTIKLEHACWFQYDKDDNVIGLTNYETDDITGTVFLAMRMVEEVLPLAMPPADYVRKVRPVEKPDNGKGLP